MRRMITVAIASLFMSAAFGVSPAGAQHPKAQAEHTRRETEKKREHELQKKKEEEHRRKEAEKKREHELQKKKEEHRKKEAEKKREHELQRKKEEEHRKKEAERKREHELQEKKKQAVEHRKKEAEKKHEHTPQEKRIVETLHKVVANLHRADHDYDNQRHEALEHVRSALHNLHAADPGASGKSGGMTQAKSDAILRDTLGPLRTVREELSAKGAPPHHGAALAQIDAAVAKIQEALKKR